MMRIVLDYGGTIVDEVDESIYSKIIANDNSVVPSAGYIAYKSFSLGIIESENEYLDVLSALTNEPRRNCEEYLEKRKKAATLPQTRVNVLEELAKEHSLVLFSDQVKPWIEESLHRLDILEYFDELVVSSSVKAEKPHPRGYIEAMGDKDAVMVSDELNADLLMADYLGMHTVWISNEYEEIHREPGYEIDDLVELPRILEEIPG